MSIMNKVSEILSANPGVSWNDLVRNRLQLAVAAPHGTLPDLWDRWLTAQGFTTGSLQDKLARYWTSNSVPQAERNYFYLGVRAFFSATVPGAPSIGTATGGNAQATVTFTAPGSNGGSAITGYRVTSSPGGITATGAGSPIVVTGLTNGTAYTFTVQAQNAIGFSAASAASNSVTPASATFSLTNRSIASAGGVGNGFTFFRNGTLTERINDVNGTSVSGQWVATGATATIGDGYEVVPTIGTGSFAGGVVSGTAYALSTDRQIMLLGTGSFTAIIRVIGGGATVAGPATITIT
jgi:hypothetical protein